MLNVRPDSRSPAVQSTGGVNGSARDGASIVVNWRPGRQVACMEHAREIGLHAGVSGILLAFDIDAQRCPYCLLGYGKA